MNYPYCPECNTEIPMLTITNHLIGYTVCDICNHENKIDYHHREFVIGSFVSELLKNSEMSE